MLNPPCPGEPPGAPFVPRLLASGARPHPRVGKPISSYVEEPVSAPARLPLRDPDMQIPAAGSEPLQSPRGFESSSSRVFTSWYLIRRMDSTAVSPHAFATS